jgi:uncharacterized protein YecE (DUF72 family)
MKPVRIGCSGWAYKEWRGAFYPEKLPQRSWLAHYASEFGTVEVNSTFYSLPSEKTVATWLEQTPPDFRFTVKASRYITHVKRLNSPEKYVERFLASIEPLRKAGRLEAILWQLPPSFKRNDERLDEALTVIGERAPGRHAVELRNESWFTKDAYELLRGHRAALVITDDPGLAFGKRELTADWTYIRFHGGGRGGGRGDYTKPELATWRRRIAAWRKRTEVIAYFNNTSDGPAALNARALAAGFS